MQPAEVTAIAENPKIAAFREMSIAIGKMNAYGETLHSYISKEKLLRDDLDLELRSDARNELHWNLIGADRANGFREVHLLLVEGGARRDGCRVDVLRRDRAEQLSVFADGTRDLDVE